VCPNCGTPKPAPARRATAEEVDGNCLELDPEVLHAMRVEQAKVDGPARVPVGAAPIVAASIRKNHFERQEAQQHLRQAMALWVGWQYSQGRDEAEAYRRFFYKFGRDVLSAQSLGAGDADTLRGNVRDDLNANNIVEAK
jgi:DNA repair protein RadD